ncbi:MAG TPA: asparagine synthase C-terminal domain-containing protein [Rhodocyclaceae bacterium]|nr:asparagine synthase C-terminal domain-containing protein [Rhodocyclaceae bacterium]
MIRGHIDFDLLDRHTPLPSEPLTQGQALVLPGLELFADGLHVQVFQESHAVLLVIGTPRVRDVRLAQHIKYSGWGYVLPWLRSTPKDILNQLGGRFSLLWLNTQNGRIGLASDRFNTYGFCYAQEGRRIAFADRADAVPVSARTLDPQALFNYLYFHVIPAPATIFCGVKRLQPGAWLEASAEGVVEQPWWVAKFDEPPKSKFYPLAETFRTLVHEAVLRETSNGQVGAFLSGGTDSSTVVGMLAKATGQAPQAYSIGFEAEGYDEMEFARIAANHFGAQHRAYYVTPSDLVEGIPQVAAHYDQPFGNSSSLPAYYCAKMARADGLTKLLAGDGGDELFGGNTRYAKQRIFGYYDNVPGIFKSPLEFFLKQTRSLPLLRKAASYVDQANQPLPDRMEQYNLLHRLGIDNIFAPNFLSQVDLQAPMQLQQQVWQSVQAKTLINKMLGFDWRFTLADNDLPKVLGTTSLAGMQVAFPFLDDDLVDFSLALPPKYKLHGLKLRWFFKEALRDFLPDEIITKKKQGFGLPFGHWALKDPALRQLARSSLMAFADRGVLRGDFLVELFDKRLPEHPGYYGEMVWIAMMLEQWLDAKAPEFHL